MVPQAAAVWWCPRGGDAAEATQVPWATWEGSGLPASSQTAGDFLPSFPRVLRAALPPLGQHSPLSNTGLSPCGLPPPRPPKEEPSLPKAAAWWWHGGDEGHMKRPWGQPGWALWGAHAPGTRFPPRRHVPCKPGAAGGCVPGSTRAASPGLCVAGLGAACSCSCPRAPCGHPGRDAPPGDGAARLQAPPACPFAPRRNYNQSCGVDGPGSCCTLDHIPLVR